MKADRVRSAGSARRRATTTPMSTASPGRRAPTRGLLARCLMSSEAIAGDDDRDRTDGWSAASREETRFPVTALACIVHGVSFSTPTTVLA